MTIDAAVAADHLVGNLWMDLEAVALFAGRVEPESMRIAAPGPAAAVYSEMCRLMRSPSDQLSAGALEAGLKAQGFDFSWLYNLQSRILPDGISGMYGYADAINNAADLQRVRQHCAEALNAAGEEGARADAITANLIQRMTADANRSASDIRTLDDIAAEVRAEMRDVRAGKSTWGAPTGFKSLDKYISMVDGDLLVIGGRPSQGKTSLWYQKFINRAQQIVDAGEDGQVLMFSADDGDNKLFYKMACTIAGVDNQQLEQNTATPEMWDKFDRACDYLLTLPIRIDGMDGQTTETLYYRAAMLNAQKRLRLVGADYLELIDVPGVDNELQRVQAAARGCKSIGRQFKCPFSLLSQLRKEVDSRADKWPTAADLKYAGEAEADTMLLIMRPEHYLSRGESCEYSPGDEEGVALVSIAKTKTGQVGQVRMGFKAAHRQFYDIPQRTRIELNEY